MLPEPTEGHSTRHASPACGLFLSWSNQLERSSKAVSSFRVVSDQGPDVLGLMGNAMYRLLQQDLIHPLPPTQENETGAKGIFLPRVSLLCVSVIFSASFS